MEMFMRLPVLSADHMDFATVGLLKGDEGDV